MAFLIKSTPLIYFFLCFSSSVLIAKAMVFENFKGFDASKWQFVSDRVMGGISYGEFKLLSEKERTFLKMTGKVSLENNGGFIQVRKKLKRKINSTFSGIKLNARGNNSVYFIHIRTKFTLLPWQYYQLGFSVSKNWKEFNLKFDDFKRSGSFLPKYINPSFITSIAIVAYGKEYLVDVDIAEIILF